MREDWPVAHAAPQERTAIGRPSVHRCALVGVLNGKLREVMGNAVTQEEAFARATAC